ncbi:MAG: serine/threonine-protein kinase [Gemmatimonadales bacterium]
MADTLDKLELALKDRYLLEHKLGRGGMATVYLARDLKHDRPVALKVVRRGVAASVGHDRFLKEIRISAQLTHPQILPLYDSGEAGGFLFYAMPFVDGESLRDRLEGVGPLPVAEVASLLRDVLEALEHAHKQDVVHRDIKPDNIMLIGRRAVVMDFGVAKAISAASSGGNATTAGVVLGTPMYMAPEQAMADPEIDHRADLYAVGILAYEMLTGEPPFAGPSPQSILAAQVTEEPKDVRLRRQEVSPNLAKLVMKSLRKEPERRWQSATEMLAVLDAELLSSGDFPPIQQTAEMKVPKARRNWWPFKKET